ncbi:hypothetical protein Scep_016618 [Stephania cephalantha]|uniref:Uncharacterized protein n=1 Tax=Stephania cephalantha TaxID=152367 RepID=A0AAP0NUU2_9MAGN
MKSIEEEVQEFLQVEVRFAYVLIETSKIEFAKLCFNKEIQLYIVVYFFHLKFVHLLV